MTVAVQISRTRYNVRSNPPPALEAVLARLNRYGGACSKDEVRAAAKREDREYDDVGPADDLVRFLKNQGVLLADGNVYYFDLERARVVANACRVRTDPPPANPTEQRLLELMTAWSQAKIIARRVAVTDQGGVSSQTTDGVPSTVTADRASVPPSLDDGFGLTDLVQSVQLALLDDQERVPQLRQRREELQAMIPGLQSKANLDRIAVQEAQHAVTELQASEQRAASLLNLQVHFSVVAKEALQQMRDALQRLEYDIAAKNDELELIDQELRHREPRLKQGENLLERARTLSLELAAFTAEAE